MHYYITTAIDYVNSRPHLGTAYEKMAADVVARYRRATGYDVHFLMGNDEHSQKVAQAAREQGLDPLAYCDQMETTFRETWSALDVEPDDFIRTTQERHQVAVREMVTRIQAAGDLYQGLYEGWYCVGCEAFKKEDELEDGKCAEHPLGEVQWIKEQNWFFRLSDYRDRLLEHFEQHPEFVRPDSRRNEILSLLRAGLEDVSVSRSSEDWGVRFPFDDQAVVYVWFDALINYISAIGFPDQLETFETWWPADLHLIGKDITRFHCVIWPAMLMSANIPLPACIFGHGFVNMGGDRLSKSSGHRVDPQQLVEIFGSDAVRYYVCREAAFGQDLDYTQDRLLQRYTGELSNGIGNLASRLEAMEVKYRDGNVGPFPTESDLLDRARASVLTYRECMDSLDLRGGVQAAMSIVNAANVHVDRTAPFRLAKDPARADTLQAVLAELVGSLLIATRLLWPIMPRRMATLHERLCGCTPDPASAISTAAAAGIPEDWRISRGPPLFPRLEESPV